MPTGWPFIVGFVAPLVVAFICNWAAYLVLLLAQCTCKGQLKSSNGVRMFSRHYLAVIAILSILFTAAWVFALISIGFELPRSIHEPTQYIFAVFIALHAVFTLILHTIRSGKASEFWRKLWYALTCRKEKYVPSRTYITANTTLERIKDNKERVSDSPPSNELTEGIPMRPELTSDFVQVVENTYVMESSGTDMVADDEQLKEDLAKAVGDDEDDAEDGTIATRL